VQLGSQDPAGEHPEAELGRGAKLRLNIAERQLRAGVPPLLEDPEDVSVVLLERYEDVEERGARRRSRRCRRKV
jgi:hypothetical protein